MLEIQRQVQAFCDRHNLHSPPEHRVLDALSELGEVAKEVLKMSDYGRKPLQFRPEIGMELGDLLFSILTIANSFGIDLEEALAVVLTKYEKRLHSGGAGSDYEPI